MSNNASRNGPEFATKKIKTPYEIIDTDPHFKRVVRYARPSDYGVFVAGTAAFPAGIYLLERYFPTNLPKGGMAAAMRLSTFLGAVGGFLFAYQSSSARFWGWTENAREIVKDRAEMKAKLRKGEPLYGETPLPPHIQETAARNSRYSALKFCKTSSRDLTNGSYHAMV